MPTECSNFVQWLQDAKLDPEKLDEQEKAVLYAVFLLLQHNAHDYASKRIAEQVLLHSQCRLKFAQIARLLKCSSRSLSRHQHLSAKQVLEQIQHRQRGRPYGKLLPRHTGAIAQFLLQYPNASRQDILDFIERTWGFRVSYVALWNFLKKYGLDRNSLNEMKNPKPTDTNRPPGEEAGPSPSTGKPSKASASNPPPRSCKEANSSPSTSQQSKLSAPNTPPLSRQAIHPIIVAQTPAPSGGALTEPISFYAHTQYAGAFLLWPQVMGWLDIARDCFSDDFGLLQRGFLTSAFGLITGLERVFHLDQMQDRGFALLTGDSWRCPSRHRVGAWRRHLRWNEVDRFCHRTSPWEPLHNQSLLMSFDEHTIPRWTKKFSIPKGYVTTRNKYMRCEKLFLGYEVEQDRFVTIKGTPGNVELRDVAGLLTRRVLRFGCPASLHALFDAGAGKSDADVRALLDMAAATSNLEVTLRACRYPARMRRWKALPAEEFVWYEEPGVCVGAPPKQLGIAETATVLKNEAEDQAVRTIVCRQVIRGPKKDRWHPLYTSQSAEAKEAGEVVDDFRLRQHHEQGFRVEVHDEFVNTAPCGYDKESPDRLRPRFHRGPLQMIGWLAALVFNLCADFASGLSGSYAGRFVKTLRRIFFNQAGTIYCTPTSLIVHLDWFPEQEFLHEYIDTFNAAEHRVPWYDNRRLVLSLTPHPPRAGP